MSDYKTYFIRVNCKWIKVTTSVARWAGIPRAVVTTACKVSPLALSTMLAAAALPPRPIAPVAPPMVLASAPVLAFPAPYLAESAFDSDIAAGNLGGVGVSGGGGGWGGSSSGIGNVPPLASDSPIPESPSPGAAPGSPPGSPPDSPPGTPPATPAGQTPAQTTRPVTPVPEPDSVLVFVAALAMLPVASGRRVPLRH